MVALTNVIMKYFVLLPKVVVVVVWQPNVFLCTNFLRISLKFHIQKVVFCLIFKSRSFVIGPLQPSSYLESLARTGNAILEKCCNDIVFFCWCFVVLLSLLWFPFHWLIAFGLLALSLWHEKKGDKFFGKRCLLLKKNYIFMTIESLGDNKFVS